MDGRVDDVGEHHGREHPVGVTLAASASDEFLDLVENRVCLPGEWGVRAFQLDELGARDLPRHVARAFDRGDRVAITMDDQRRYRDRVQHRVYVDVGDPRS